MIAGRRFPDACRPCIAAGSMRQQLRPQPSLVPAAVPEGSDWARNNVDAGIAPACSAGLDNIYPTKPIRMIVPYPAGGVADVSARIVAQKLGELPGSRW